MLAVAVGLAVPWARLDWDNPKQMNSTWGVLLSYLADLVLGLLAGGLLCLPVLAQVIAPALTPLAWAIGIIGAVAVTAAISALALALGLSRLPHVGEA